MKKIRNFVRRFRLSRGYFTLDEVMHAIEITGNAKDRFDFEWKLKNTLKSMQVPNEN